MGFSLFTAYLIYSQLKGSPYVPTKQKDVEVILNELQIKKGQIFYELGCGDGRVVRTAVIKYDVKGIGIDINPVLLVWARLLARIKSTSVIFRKENILETDLRKVDYVYLFLMPKLINKLTPKMLKELKKTSIIVSHGFKIENWPKKPYKTILGKPFYTYFYRA